MRSFFYEDENINRPRVALAVFLIAVITGVVGLVVLNGGGSAQEPDAEVPVVTAGEVPTVTVSVPGQNDPNVNYEAACAQLTAALEEVLKTTQEPALPAEGAASGAPAANPEDVLGVVLGESVTTKFNEFSVMVATGPAFDAAVIVRDTARLSEANTNVFIDWAVKNCAPDTGGSGPAGTTEPGVVPSPPPTATPPPGYVPDTRVGPVPGEPIPGAVTDPANPVDDEDSGPPPPPPADIYG